MSEHQDPPVPKEDDEHPPERRSGIDRRTGIDRRLADRRILDGFLFDVHLTSLPESDRRSGDDRRSGQERRSGEERRQDAGSETPPKGGSGASGDTSG